MYVVEVLITDMNTTRRVFLCTSGILKAMDGGFLPSSAIIYDNSMSAAAAIESFARDFSSSISPTIFRYYFRIVKVSNTVWKIDYNGKGQRYFYDKKDVALVLDEILDYDTVTITHILGDYWRIEE